MNPRNLIVGLLIVLCLVGFGTVGYGVQQLSLDVASAPRPTSAPEIAFVPEGQGIVFLETATPFDLPTLEPTRTPVDYGDLPITQTSVAMRVEEAAALQQIVSARGTQKALDDQSGIETATQQAVATGTAWAVATADQKAILDLTPQHANAVKLEQDIRQQEKLDQAEIVVTYVWQVGGSVVVLLVVVLGCLLLYYRIQLAQHRKAVELSNDEFLEQIIPAQIITGPQAVFEHSVAITNDEKEILRKAVSDVGAKLSRSLIVPTYFKRARWQEIRLELLHVGVSGYAYAEENSDESITMTREGLEWLGITPTTPPLVEKSLENSISAGSTQPSPAQPTEGEGNTGENDEGIA